MHQIPSPGPMPVEAEQWRSDINLSLFVNTYYQYRDLQRLGLSGKRILVVGSGQGLDALVYRWKGYDVTTFDIDNAFEPDVIGSVHDLSQFDDKSFDAVVASHVLEHLPESFLDKALAEIARVGNGAIIYLPVHGRHIQLRLIPGFGGIDVSFTLDMFNYFEKPDGKSARYMDGHHYWEVGMRGFRVADLKRRFGRYFDIIKCYRNKDWLPSQNFVMRPKDL